MPDWTVRFLEKPEEMSAVEDLQRLVWPDNETEIIPAHMLIAVSNNGGLVLGAYEGAPRPFSESEEQAEKSSQEEPNLIGFVFGFPGIYQTPDGPRLKHTSHMLGVHPDHRNLGLGFALKRAQWQMVRRQGVDRITWTFDPLLSVNAYLNITRLGAVCNTYKRNEYGELRDGLNAGLPTDRFQVDWWVNTKRVNRRLSSKPRLRLDLAHFLSAEAQIINATHPGDGGFVRPGPVELDQAVRSADKNDPIMLVEIPTDFLALKAADEELALEWRLHTRELFERVFKLGYLVTDFIHLPGASSRSFYVLSHGESTL